MKQLAALLILTLAFTTTQAQITNPGFETASDTLTTMPFAWKKRSTESYTVKLTDQEKHTGSKALQIQSVSEIPDMYQSVSTRSPLNVKALKLLEVTAYIKTKDVGGSAQLWVQALDGKDRIISYQNSLTLNQAISGTADWKKALVKIAVDTNTKTLAVGAFVMGSGTVWVDDFDIKDVAKTTGGTSKDVLKFGHEVTDLVKRRAIYADSVNWQATDKGLQELAAWGLTMDDSPLILEYIVSRLRLAGDKHTNYQTKTIAQNYATRNSVTEQPQGKLLPGIIGYISVPAFASTSDTAGVNFATRIQQFIRDMDTRQEIKGWVVDLRRNGGGSMYPMISGLGPLIGEGTLGYFIAPGSKSKNAWIYKNGSSGVNGSKQYTVKNAYQLRRPDSKIAVLAGPNTGSSGEMTTLCFVGKPNAKLFGEPTAGYITANQSIKLSTGAYLYLATTYVADRNQKKYTINIQPDVVVEKGKDKSSDPPLEAALKWLQD